MNIDFVWVNALHRVLMGDRVSPRGMATLEIPHGKIEIDMKHCVLTLPERKLNYRFMAANAHWILSGSDKTEDIVPFNSNLAQFSDDGVIFAGAYGPPIVKQLRYIVDKLVEDPDTRQGVLTIWKPCPAPSKDIPCTVAMTFCIRGGYLNCHTFMRSSDLWLGVPYDVFDFSMAAALITGMVNEERPLCDQLKLGTLYMTAASSHLYEQHWEAARAMVRSSSADHTGLWAGTFPMPTELYQGRGAAHRLMSYLEQLRNTKREDPLRWWHK